MALVTGASRGIGRAIALDLAASGAEVVVNYAASADAAEAVVEAITATGGLAWSHRADVSQEPEVEAVILARAEEIGAQLRRAPRVRALGRPRPLEPPADGEPLPVPTQTVALATAAGELRIRLPLAGEHQWGNLAVAWAAIQALGERGFPVTRRQFARGVEGLRWPARLEVVAAHPWVVLDCAHNVPSLRALAAALPVTLRYRRLVLVYGLSADKEIEAATAEIAPLADVVVLTQALTQRALWVSELAKATWSLWRPAPHVTWTVEEALQQARALADVELQRQGFSIRGGWYVVYETRGHNEILVRYER